MDMNIDFDRIAPMLNKLFSHTNTISNKASNLQSALELASTGIQSKNFPKVQNAVAASVTTMKNVVGALCYAQNSIDQLIAIVEDYLNLKY